MRARNSARRYPLDGDHADHGPMDANLQFRICSHRWKPRVVSPRNLPPTRCGAVNRSSTRTSTFFAGVWQRVLTATPVVKVVAKWPGAFIVASRAMHARIPSFTACRRLRQLAQRQVPRSGAALRLHVC